MKITRFGLVMLLSVTLISLMACKNEKSEQKESTSTSISQTKDILASLGLENQNDVDTWETPLSILVLESSYMGASTLEGKTLEADNIFVATLEEMETTYPNPVYDENGKLISNTPKTNFKLNVIDNLRGDLPTGETIQASRDYFGNGDGQEKGKFLTLIENDIIPEVGKTYVFLTFVLDGELAILPGGEAPSNFPLENAPMNLDKQTRSVVEDIVDSSTKVEEIEKQVENEKETFDKIGDTMLSAPEIQARIEGHGNKLDMNKVIIK
ncbi:hypothetical protein [Enterococcus ureasiticus]|uniref:Lipoprotein n=1 Tax=Enterococcus ureasiticus TaxID=903984 RepID=A0A1E5GDI1_9ENTE|nr:hypothetical protein [Enterococcus ureasiticus]OEG10752.1 hypothetical protein BCR21_10650 [Enterococcus ureasiticus]